MQVDRLAEGLGSVRRVRAKDGSARRDSRTRRRKPTPRDGSAAPRGPRDLDATRRVRRRAGHRARARFYDDADADNENRFHRP